jgi:methyl-accepting chemotaxis protein
MLSGLTIKAKLLTGFGIVAFLLIAVGSLQFLTIKSMSRNTDEIVRSSTYLKAVMEMKVAVARNLETAKDMIIATDHEGIKSSNRKANAIHDDFEMYANALLKGGSKDGYRIYATSNKNIRTQVTKLIEFYKSTITPRIRTIYETKMASTDGDFLALAATLDDLEKVKAELNMTSRGLTDGLMKLEVIVKADIKAAEDNSISSSDLASLVAAAGIAFALLIASLVAYVMNRSISRPLTKCLDFAKAIADGDLTQRLSIESDDETGRLATMLNTMADNLKEIMEALAHSTGVLASNAEELSTTIRELASGADIQVAQTEQSATSMTEMAQTIMEVARNAGDVAITAEDTMRTAEDGSSKVTQTVEGIRHIADTVHHASDTIEQLGRSSQEIGDIINTINDIADQTNLLALNAAIEAARAGEQGRGFAVVADEVRKLAERTAKATGEIRDMILHIQKNTEESVISMKSGKEDVDRGITLAEEAMSALTHIVESANESADMVRRIAASTEEQSSAVEEVSVTIEEIASITKRSQSAAKKLTQSVDELSKIAVETNSLIQWFRL